MNRGSVLSNSMSGTSGSGVTNPVKIYHQDGQVDLFCSNGPFKNCDSKLEYRASLPSEKCFLALQSTHDKGRSTFFGGVQLSAWCQKGIIWDR